MKTFKYLTPFLVFLISLNSFSQDFCTWVDEHRIPLNGNRWIVPQQFKTIEADLFQLKTQLKKAPMEFTDSQPVMLNLPLPDGTIEAFHVVETKIMEQGLANKFPEIKAYSGYAINQPNTLLKMDVSPKGFKAYMISDNGTFSIDPYHDNTTSHYVVYRKSDYEKNASFECLNIDHSKADKQSNHNYLKKVQPECTFREYRLAVNATGEYTEFHGGTVSGALSAIVSAINRINLIYEKDMSLRMVLVANNDEVIYTNPATDPFLDISDSDAMIAKSHANLNLTIGAFNYDIGHVFSVEGAGLARVASVCRNNLKGYGLTGIFPPTGDVFDVDYLAHEFGHQFGAEHTWDYCTAGGYAGGNGASGMEPGSGSTIMGYAGVCGPQNIQSSSDPYFHSYSILQITNYTQNDFGSNCATIIDTGNSGPVVEAGSNHYIPAYTPFELTGSATDADGDNLTYCWEEFESGTDAPVENPSANSVLFRSWSPNTQGTRVFPRLFDLLNNTTSFGETLPFTDRTMRFRLTVRDNHLGGGCTNFDDMNIIIDGDAGPFTVTEPNGNEEWKALDMQTVSWDVAGTNQSPVDCDEVDILLSTDGGSSFPITLASGVPNNGSYNIIVPNNQTTVARIKVACSSSIFFDISNDEFEIGLPGMPSFNLTAQSEVKVCVGENIAFPIEIGQTQNFSDPVTLSTAGLPDGAQISFDNNPVSPGSTVMATISNTGDLIPNNYFSLNISGTSADLNENIVMDLVTVGNVGGAPSLNNPANGSLNISSGTALTWQGDFSQLIDNFEIEIATDPLFNNIIEGGVISMSTFTPLIANEESTTYYWRVLSSNACGNSLWSNVYQYTTGKCLSFSNGTNTTISPVGTPTITSTIEVSNAGTITSVSIYNLTGTHTWINDLSASLTSPEGTTVVLFGGLCNSEDNFNLDFSNNGSPQSNIPCPPTDSEDYLPLSGSFNNMLGENGNGTWTLTITDSFSQDGGQLSNWGLNVCTDVSGNLMVNAATDTDAICGSGSAVLTAAGAQNYVWSPPNGLNTITGAEIMASPAATTTYTVTGTDAGGFINTDQVTITVGSGSGGTDVSFVDFPNPPLVTDGLPVQLNGTPSGGTFSGEGVVFSFFNPSLVGPGLYTITYSYDDGGCISTVSKEILVGEFFSNFVNYQLGTIQPKILIEGEAFVDGPQIISLSDITGRIVQQDVIHLNKGKQQLKIGLQQALKGVYFLKIGQYSLTQKIYLD